MPVTRGCARHWNLTSSTNRMRCASMPFTGRRHLRVLGKVCPRPSFPSPWPLTCAATCANPMRKALLRHCARTVATVSQLAVLGAKNTLDVNYLPLARCSGAALFSGIEVDWLERLPDRRWRVHAFVRQGGYGILPVQVLGRSVVLSAGSLGSTKILLRSSKRGLALSDSLDTRFSANGDVLGFGYNTDVQTNIRGYGTGAPPPGQQRVGPTITCAASHRTHPLVSQRYLIEDAAIPKALFDAVRVALSAAAGLFADVPAAHNAWRGICWPREPTVR
jgi:hypothetical protein